MTTALRFAPPRRDVDYCGFTDPSGGAKDSFTCAVAHLEEDVAVLDALLEIPAPFDPANATKQVAALLASYGLREAIGDRYGAAWVVSEFDRCGVYYKHSDRDRSAIYLDTLPLFTSGRARLLDNARLVSQFAGLERKTSSLGRDKVDHGPGGHDDLCNAAAGALVNVVNESQNRLTSMSFYEAFRADAPIDDANENFAEATLAFQRGELAKHDIAWYLAERARRAMRAGR